MLAAAGDTTTEVFYGSPGRVVPQRFIAVADTDAGVAREQRTLPLRKASSRTETYDVRLVVWVQVNDHDAQQAATEAVWDLVDLIDNDLRDEPSLDGLVTWALPSLFDDRDFLLNEGRAAQVIVQVSVHVNRS